MALAGKKLLLMHERDTGSTLSQEDSPRGRNGNSLQHACLENPMDRAAWRATIHGVTKSQTRLKQLNTHTFSKR